MRSPIRSARIAGVFISIANVLGMILSVYAFHVESSVHSDPTFKALCDISERMSCSKVFSSKYGKGFGIIGPLFGEDSILVQPNSVYGMLFYITHSLLAFKTSLAMAAVQLVNAIIGTVGCVYLAYVLMFILNDVCVVCVSTYVLTIIILVCSVVKYRAVRSIHVEKKQKNSSKKAK